MSDGWISALIMPIVVIIIVILIIISCAFSSTHSSKTHKPNSKRKRHRFHRSLNKKLEVKLFQIIKTGTDEEFTKFLEKNEGIMKSKYFLHAHKTIGIFKRSLRNVVFNHTTEVPVERLKLLEEKMPFLRRVYFGPIYTDIVYSEENKKRIFRFKSQTPLPQISSVIDLALFLKTNVNVLLGYSYTQNPENKSYFTKRPKKEYRSRFYFHSFILKRNGTRRLISKPHFQLKMLQRKILHEILEKAECNESCTGFIIGKNIVDNAKKHVHSNILLKIDLKDFFPSLSFLHVFQVFRGLGYSRPVSGVLAGICTDHYHSPRFTPQGAPTSPMIANLYASHLDARLKGLWEKQGFHYTRYADDITISSETSPSEISYMNNPRIRKMIYCTYKIIESEHLRPNYQKTKIFRKGNRMEVTGIVVNEKINVNRAWINTLRGEIHHFKNDIVQDMLQSGEEREQIRNRIMGKIAFLNMVNPQKAALYRTKMVQDSQ